MAKINDFEISAVISEQLDTSFSMGLTVFENQQQIIDNMVKSPDTLHLVGVISDIDAKNGAEKFEQLMNMVRNKERVTYTGRTIVDGYITALKTKHHHKNGEGFDFELTITNYLPIK